ncbi:cobaltochelatase CobN subunit [Corchorus capsularis]|uniref:Cobaltochelatase CobN subunit n=1 Tax=Corchorus capsularis TaxID=210143 RepID=A0A1R3JMP4_COCAP|nr:cobaltochelatase CobN subunit [Corchorus capsularis]
MAQISWPIWDNLVRRILDWPGLLGLLTCRTRTETPTRVS